MGVIATGSKTIVDLSDGKSLSCYLTSNLPKTQIYNPNTNPGTYIPDWSDSQKHLVITPSVSANQQDVTSSVTVTWKRRLGGGGEGDLDNATETTSNNTLTVDANNLGTESSGMITYVAYASYTDPDTNIPSTIKADITFALTRIGENGADGTSAKSAYLSGEQVFKYSSATATPTPTTLQLTAHLQGVEVSGWYVKNGNGWNKIGNTTQDSSLTLTISPDDTNIWHANSSVETIKVATSDANVYDIMSIYKVIDGREGNPAIVAFLSNEMMTFPGNNDGVVAANTSFTCDAVGFSGTNGAVVNINYNGITGIPMDGATQLMEITANGEATTSGAPFTVTIKQNTNLGGVGEQHGQITIPVTVAGANVNLKLNWSKVNTGPTGASAVNMSVFAPKGATFKNGDSTMSLKLEVFAYDGSTNIVTTAGAASYKWYKYDITEQTNWKELTGQTTYQLTVRGDEVDGLATYKCIMRYKNKDYMDTIDVTDKTDPYQAGIDSTGGDIFKNARGTSFLICRLWQNADEVDTQKTTIYSSVNPPTSEEAVAAPVGSYCYYCPVSNYNSSPFAVKNTVILKKQANGTWKTDTTVKHDKTYTWTRRDKNGDAIAGNFATGKVIFVDSSDVSDKNTFMCTVSDGAVS